MAHAGLYCRRILFNRFTGYAWKLFKIKSCLFRLQLALRPVAKLMWITSHDWHWLSSGKFIKIFNELTVLLFELGVDLKIFSHFLLVIHIFLLLGNVILILVVKSFFLTTIVGVESDLHLLAIFSYRVLFEVCYQNLHDTVKNTLNYRTVIT